jgi:site-specific DNA-methyltransferase (adenine-specific)
MQKECKLINGDFFEEEKWFGDDVFDLIFPDPPYNKLQQAGQDWDQAIDWELAERVLARILKPNGLLILFSDLLLAVELINKLTHYFQFHGFHIWQKPGGTPSNKFHPISNSEHILVFRPIAAKVSDLTFNPKVVIPKGKPYIKRNSSSEIPTRRQKKSEININRTGDRWVKTVLTGPSKPNMCRDERTSHPTQKPLNILRDLIRCYSNPGDLILDPFSGSGSTLIAAYQEKRRSIGIEKDETFYQESLLRIQAATSQGLLF